MNDFVTLSSEESPVSIIQVEKALRELYGEPSHIQIEPFRQGTSTWFCIRNGTASRQLLRISDFGRHRPEELESEVVWIAELIRDGELVIPRPVAGRSGGYIQSFGSAKSPCGGIFTLFHLPAAALIGCATQDEPRLFRQLGETAALLHQSALLWDAGEKLSRPSLPYGAILSRPAAADGEDGRLFTGDLPGLLAHAADTVRRQLETYGRSEEHFGLIHGALRPENLLSVGGRTGILDFDSCEFGWFLYDFAPAVDGIAWNQLPSLTSAWLEGYRIKRKISRREARLLPTFVMLRRLELLAAEPARIGQTASFASDYLREFG